MKTTTAQTLTVEQVLLRAALRIETNGLHRGNFFPLPLKVDTADGPCCADAAIKLATGLSPTEIHIDGRSNALAIEAEEWLVEHLVRCGQNTCETAGDLDYVETIGLWNDREGMTAEEVAEILRDVAELVTAS